jgi:DNA replication protein DnaC
MSEFIGLGSVLTPQTPRSGDSKLNETGSAKSSSSANQSADGLHEINEILERLRARPCRVCSNQLADCTCHGEQEARTPQRDNQSLIDLGFFAEHASARLTDFDRRIRDAVAALIKNPQNVRGLFVKGGPGPGKTRLLAGIAHHLLSVPKPRVSIRFSTAPAFFDRFFATYRTGATESIEQVKNDFGGADWLLLDDIGKEGKPTDAVFARLHEIISIRHGNYRPTVISTNLELAEIAERYDASLASRLGSWMPLTITGKDRRLA